MSDDFGKAISAGYAALADGSWTAPPEWHVCRHGHKHSTEADAWYCSEVGRLMTVGYRYMGGEGWRYPA